MQISGQITVTTAGSAVQGPEGPGGEFILKAHPDNTGAVYVGNDGAGDVDLNNGFVLQPGAVLVLSETRYWASEGLSNIWFDAETNGNKICWILV